MFCSNPGVENHQQTIPDCEINNCSETFLARESGRVRKRSSKCFSKTSLYKPFIIVQARTTSHYCRLRRPCIQQIYYVVCFPLSHIAHYQLRNPLVTYCSCFTASSRCNGRFGSCPLHRRHSWTSGRNRVWCRVSIAEILIIASEMLCQSQVSLRERKALTLRNDGRKG
jgi:hypothetical protein